MRRLRIAALWIVALGGGVLAVGWSLPSRWEVERSVPVRAPPEAIYPYVARLRSWPEWSPWTAAVDPTYRVSFGGSDAGVGATSSWDGERLGEGSLTVVAADPAWGIAYEASIWRGAHAVKGSMTFRRAGEATWVVWRNEGELGKNPLRRYVRFILDGYVGPDLERGLAKLAQVVESRAGARPAP